MPSKGLSPYTFIATYTLLHLISLDDIYRFTLPPLLEMDT